jgi:cytochrome d ubiquinol oxidase subunit II
MNFAFDLNSIWFILVGTLFAGYAILDGFDLGVGALHLFSRTDNERRIFINSIGPVWDGNEVWLVTGGGALFAAFPIVYATAFSGFYLAFMMLLFALIFRAVAIEFRSKKPQAWWRKFWDVSFSVSSIVSGLLVGIALGNIAQGIPLDNNYEYAGTFLGLLNPYALLVGITTVALFMMHGSIYLAMKTENELHDKIRRWIGKTIIFFMVCYAVTTIATLLFNPHMIETLKNHPLLFVIPVFNILAIINVPRQIRLKRDFRAFISSCLAILALLILFGIGMYPHMIYSLPNPENSLTIYNAASSAKTLQIMLIIAIVGMPMVLAYTVVVYRIFRGKVKLEPTSY